MRSTSWANLVSNGTGAPAEQTAFAGGAHIIDGSSMAEIV